MLIGVGNRLLLSFGLINYEICIMFKKSLFTLLLSLLLNYGFGQVVLDANGPGDTYELITSVLAPGAEPIEAPDCSHTEFGEHIDEVFDEELNKDVFRFYIHTSPDDDRCITFDRQRNEIKTYDKSPENLLGIENEKVIYSWKFKLPEGFQSSPNFTHLHQLKSVGGSFASMPMYTLTTRKGDPDRLELRYAETDKQITLTRTDLSPFIGNWVEVTETIEYGTDGTYDIEINRIADDETLFSYNDSSIINWRPEADFVRPKWGIYRSLINAQDLRDEEVLFADFSIEEIRTTSNTESLKSSLEIFPNPVSNTLSIKNHLGKLNKIQILSLEGLKILDLSVKSNNTIHLDVSFIQSGVYLINLIGEGFNESQFFIVTN